MAQGFRRGGAVITDFGGARISDELALKKRRIHSLSEEEVLQIFKVMEYRYDYKSTIIASQLEPTE